MISGIFTALAFLAFIGVAAWAYAPYNRRRFEEAADLPLTDDPPPDTDRETPP